MNSKEFHIDRHIIKITNDSRFEIVNVEKTRQINKEVECYFVGSNTYYNIITKNILTTYQDVVIFNIYKFADNTTWPKKWHK